MCPVTQAKYMLDDRWFIYALTVLALAAIGLVIVLLYL
jgi:hypothetical protein